ncbi:hypothetical protein BH23CHL2_BH23CHL2_15920 [soil metagenome]
MPRGLATKTVAMTDAAYEIAAERQPISVRGIAYGLFTMGLIKDMNVNSTQRVSRNLTTARENGVIPWEWIVDDSRRISGWRNWSDPSAFLQDIRTQYSRDRWETQPERLLVVSEKGTVGGVIQPVLSEYGVDHLIAHGFNSATLMMRVANLSVSDDRPLTILYIGDHDPSGMYMSVEDLPRRVEAYGGLVDIERVALTGEHVYIEHRELSKFPAKKSDPRYRWYVKSYGDTAWELDALDPRILRDALEEAIREHIDIDAWTWAERTNQAEFKSLEEFFDANADLFCNQTQNRIDGAS